MGAVTQVRRDPHAAPRVPEPDPLPGELEPGVQLLGRDHARVLRHENAEPGKGLEAEGPLAVERGVGHGDRRCRERSAGQTTGPASVESRLGRVFSMMVADQAPLRCDSRDPRASGHVLDVNRAVPARLHVPANPRRSLGFEVPNWHLKRSRPGRSPVPPLCLHRTRRSDVGQRAERFGGRRFSRRNRSGPSTAAGSGWSTLIATGRSFLRSRARYPWPSRHGRARARSRNDRPAHSSGDQGARAWDRRARAATQDAGRRGSRPVNRRRRFAEARSRRGLSGVSEGLGPLPLLFEAEPHGPPLELRSVHQITTDS